MTPKHKRAKMIFERDNYQCQYCLTRFSPDQPPLHIHHRVFISQGGDNSQENLITCCYECHHNHGNLKGSKTAKETDNMVINKLTEYYRRKTKFGLS